MKKNSLLIVLILAVCLVSAIFAAGCSKIEFTVTLFVEGSGSVAFSQIDDDDWNFTEEFYTTLEWASGGDNSYLIDEQVTIASSPGRLRILVAWYYADKEGRVVADRHFEKVSVIDEQTGEQARDEETGELLFELDEDGEFIMVPVYVPRLFSTDEVVTFEMPKTDLYLIAVFRSPGFEIFELHVTVQDNLSDVIFDHDYYKNNAPDELLNAPKFVLSFQKNQNGSFYIDLLNGSGSAWFAVNEFDRDVMGEVLDEEGKVKIGVDGMPIKEKIAEWVFAGWYIWNYETEEWELYDEDLVGRIFNLPYENEIRDDFIFSFYRLLSEEYREIYFPENKLKIEAKYNYVPVPEEPER